MTVKRVRYSGKELAALLSVTPGRITQMCSEGWFQKDTGGKYKDDAVTKYIERIRPSVGGNTTDRQGDGNSDTNAERARLLKAQADKAEMDNEERRGNIASVDILRDAIIEVATQVNAKFDALPNEIKRNVPDISAKGIELVKRTVAEVKNTVSEIRLNVE